MSLSRIVSALDGITGASIVLEERLCSRIRSPRSRCDTCLKSCPSGALSLGETLELDRYRCIDCGVCISACPNGVFWSRRRNDVVLSEEIARVLFQSQDNVIRIGCPLSKPDGNRVVSLPCLGRLTENLLLAPLLRGASRIDILRPRCEGCSNCTCLRHLESVIYFGKQLAIMVGNTPDYIQEVGDGRSPNFATTRNLPISRRQLLRTIGSEAKYAAGEAFVWSSGKNERTERWVHSIGAKRAHLLRTLRKANVNGSVTVERKGIPLAEVQIGTECSGCIVCSTLCPTGALERIEQPDAIILCFWPAFCVGCGICAEACLVRAASLSPSVDLCQLTTVERRQLVHVTKIEQHEWPGEFSGSPRDIFLRYCQEQNLTSSQAQRSL